MFNLKLIEMKTLDLNLFENYLLTVEEMIVVKGGDDGEGDPIIPPSIPPVKI